MEHTVSYLRYFTVVQIYKKKLIPVLVRLFLQQDKMFPLLVAVSCSRSATVAIPHVKIPVFKYYFKTPSFTGTLDFFPGFSYFGSSPNSFSADEACQSV
jgi:hypothetical protein